MKIAHISDLHVSSPLFEPEWGDKLIRCLNKADLDLVLVTGDITMNGHLYEYQLAKEFLDRIEPRIMIIPGNHDAMNDGYELFEELFGTRKPFFEREEVAILGLDSSEPDINDGQIGRHNYPIIKEKLSRDKVRILALHHHVIPVPKTGREWNILSDAGDVLSICIEMGLDLILSGHKHLPWVWELQGSHFVTAGTACTRRLKGRSFPSYNLIRIKGPHILLDQVNLLTEESKRMIDKFHKPSQS